MTSVRVSSPKPPSAPPAPVASTGNPRRVTIIRSEVAGKALFSTELGQIASRPVTDPPEPVIARGPNNPKFELPLQIERLAQQLREAFPAQCKDIFVGYYEIGDYFDPCDIARLGKDHLNSVLNHIAEQNSAAVQDFAINLCANNRHVVQQICDGTTLGDVFSTSELREYGELFLTLTIIFVRTALERTAVLQLTRGLELSHVGKDDHATAKPGTRDREQPRTDKVPPSTLSKGLYRVGLRQPQPPPQSSEAESHLRTVVPAGQATSTNARFPQRGQAGNSAPVPSSLPQHSPYMSHKPIQLNTTPRMQQFAPSASGTHQRDRSTPRMSARAAGFVPQGPPGPPPRGGPPNGSLPPDVTTRGAPTQLYLSPAALMSGSAQAAQAAFEVGTMQRETNSVQAYPDYPPMHPGYLDLPMNPAQIYAVSQAGPRIPSGQLAGAPTAVSYMPVADYNSPPMIPLGLSNVTNMQHGAPPQNMRLRRVSGSGARQDFGSRSQHKQFGKGSRGSRRNSVRGNHSGINAHHPPVGQFGLQDGPHFQHRLPVQVTEPFPPFMPTVESNKASGFRPRPPEHLEIRHSVWVHNLPNDQISSRVEAELRKHFEKLLRRQVVDVRVNKDKNLQYYAHVNFTTASDAQDALALDGTNFSGRPLLVKVPMREQRIREEILQHQLFTQPSPIIPQLPLTRLDRTSTSQHVGSNTAIGTEIVTTSADHCRQSKSERRPSAATVTQRSRGPSRTYEATADNPMSYSPQDARRMQPAQLILSKLPAEQPGQTVPTQSPTVRPKTPFQEIEQRSDSRASSTATPSKRKKRSAMRGRDRSSTRSRSSTKTPEPSAASSVEHGTIFQKQPPPDITTPTAPGGNEGMVDKTITTIQEAIEQEKLDEATPKKENLINDSTSRICPNKKDKTSKENDKREWADEKCILAVEAVDTPSYTNVHAPAPQPDSSMEQIDPVNIGTNLMNEPEKPAPIQRVAKVAVPDITLHSRKERQGAPSTASSAGRVSYAQAASVSKAPISAASLSAAAKSPISEQDTESRYFTPMETPSSPSVKSDKTLAPATPMNTSAGNADEATPEKDDSFVTVQEEPPSVPKRNDERGHLARQRSEPKAESSHINSGATDVPSTSSGEVRLGHKADEQHGTAVAADNHATDVDEAANSQLVSTSSWADDVAPHTQSTTSIKAESSPAAEETVKTESQETGSIHPNARQKGDRKRHQKKGKSYGKGKKASK